MTREMCGWIGESTQVKKKAEKEINGWVRKDKDPEKKRRERERERAQRYGK
jgi:hypothetical protein